MDRRLHPAEFTLRQKDFSDKVAIKNGDTSQSGGANEDTTFIVKYSNNEQAVWKEHKEVWYSNYRAEVFAFEIDQLIGVERVPPTVEKSVAGQIGSLQFFKQSDPSAILSDFERNLMLFFDFLIDNRDRHIDNYIVSKDSKVILIDNGISASGSKGHYPVSLTDEIAELFDFLKTTSAKDIMMRLSDFSDHPWFKKQVASLYWHL